MVASETRAARNAAMTREEREAEARRECAGSSHEDGLQPGIVLATLQQCYRSREMPMRLEEASRAARRVRASASSRPSLKKNKTESLSEASLCPTRAN